VASGRTYRGFLASFCDDTITRHRSYYLGVRGNFRGKLNAVFAQQVVAADVGHEAANAAELVRYVIKEII
jgi:hypothetical protein